MTVQMNTAQGNGSEQQLQSGKDVVFNPSSSTFFRKDYELETLVESLDETCTRYKMKISDEKMGLFSIFIPVVNHYKTSNLTFSDKMQGDMHTLSHTTG